MSRTRKKLFGLLASTAAISASIALSTPAQAVTSWAGGAPCRGSAPAGFGVTLNPCAYQGSAGVHSVDPKVWVWSGTTDVRVHFQVFTVVNGNQLGSPASSDHNELLPRGAGNVLIGNNPSVTVTNCYGGPYVVKSWITESGVPYGDVESPQFWC
ncbi:hypothetical protein AB0G73_00920 [Streptomyces sp. NPDC020719]|uniref:hypothetical protein n=1 Tax=unclassified Streptomyces TaxID=2593676 RepID=UPI00340AD584